MSTRFRRIVAALTRLGTAFAFLVGVGTSSALAQSGVWNTSATTGGSWGNPSNWQGGIVPSGSGNWASFTLVFNAGASVTLDGNRIIGTIQSSSITPWSLDSATNDILSVGNITVTGVPLAANTRLAGGGFTKDGIGTLILSNPDSNYSGTINVNAGILGLVGSANYSTGSNVMHLASGSTLDVTQLVSGFRYGGAPDTRMNVHNGDELTGTGSVNGGLKVKSGGTVYPGEDGVGTLTIDGKGLFETGSNWQVKFNTANGGGPNDSNRLTFSSALTLEDGMNMIIDGNGLTYTAGQTYDYVISSGASSFDIGAVNLELINFDPSLIPSSADFELVSDGNNLTLRFAAIPEPTTWALIILGTLGTGACAWRKRRSVIKADLEELEEIEE